MRLDGKVVLITGAGSGIGAASPSPAVDNFRSNGSQRHPSAQNQL